MSFFGLTSFGPESIVSSNLQNKDAFGLFSDDEFRLGFEKCAQENNTGDKIKLEHTKQFLKYSLNIPPIDLEIKEFIASANRSLEEELTWEEVLEIINIIRENHNSSANKSKAYKSFQKYYDDTYKHKRKEAEPTEVFKAPITYNQNIGFQKFENGRNLNDVHRPIKKCDETKFSECMIRTGKQYL